MLLVWWVARWVGSAGWRMSGRAGGWVSEGVVGVARRDGAGE